VGFRVFRQFFRDNKLKLQYNLNLKKMYMKESNFTLVLKNFVA